MAKNQIKRKGFFGYILGSVFAYAVMGLFALLTVYPIIWLIINSFKSTPEYMMDRIGLPKSITFANYIASWQLGGFDTLIVNSVIYTIVTTAGIVFLSSMAGFAFAKIQSKATPAIYNVFLIGILLTIQSIMVPLFIMMNALKLTNTYPGILIPYIGIGLPIGVYLFTEFIKSIPTALVESARIDGAGYFRIFLKVIFPMTMPVAVTLAILTITSTWNEFILINILVSSTKMKSLPLGIFMFSGSLSSDYGKQFAALVIGMAPMLLFYLGFQKQITKGVTAGAVKG
jgi:raffinose/stachyose/melibiose transport system permease protein